MKESEDNLIRDIKSRFNQLANKRKLFETRWSDAQTYCDKYVTNWGDLEALPSVPKRYSSLPCNYLNILCNGLTGYSISPNITWFKLSLANQKLLDGYGVKDWLEEVESVMFAKFNASNLYSEAAKMIEDSIILGHGIIRVEEKKEDGQLNFKTFAANEMYLDCNAYGEVDTVFREYLLTVRQCVEFFGLENLSEEIQYEYKNIENWDHNVKILQAVMPRKEYNPEAKDAKNMPYAVYYLDLRNNKLIQESGYQDNPYAVFYWDKFPNHAYGSSPAQNALPDIKALNIAKKTSLQIAQTSAEPPMQVPEDIRQINLTPRGLNYYSSADMKIEAIRTGENYPITLEVLQDMKQEIKDWFNVDFFLMLQSKQGQMTATEVMELQGEKAATLSNLIVNLNGALLKIIQRSFDILMRNGELPELPLALRGQSGGMKVDFVGPLAQAQKKYHTTGGTIQALQVAQPILQMFPNSGDYIDGDKLMKVALEGQGMPQSVIREEDDVKKIREERIQQQQAQQQQAQQLAMTQSLMQNADKLNQTTNENSVLGQLNEQMAGAI